METELGSPSGQTLQYSSLAIALIAGGTLLGEPSRTFLYNFWVFTGNVRQGLWDYFLDIFGEDQFKLWIGGTSFILIVWYWFIGGLYTALDVTLKPETLRKYKIQPGTNEPVDNTRLKKAIIQVLLNQTVVSLPFIYLAAHLFMWRGPADVRQLPAFHWVFLQLVFCLLEQEFTYYYVHRFLHSKWLYKYFHKKHHEWTAPVAISAIYCHPVEQVVANIFPPFFGLFLQNCHLSTYFLWFSLAVLFTLSEHSGYHLPFMTSPEVHDFHHYSFINNFGFLGILDSLHGTDKMYKQSMAYPRHFVIKSLKSARELVPDKKR